MRNGGAPNKGTPPSSHLKDSLPPAEQIASSVRRGTRPFGLRSLVRHRYFCLRVLAAPLRRRLGGLSRCHHPNHILITISIPDVSALCKGELRRRPRHFWSGGGSSKESETDRKALRRAPARTGRRFRARPSAPAGLFPAPPRLVGPIFCFCFYLFYLVEHHLSILFLIFFSCFPSIL